MLKQPKGLIAAALANTGERFGFYTMMAILTLFLMSKFGIDGEQAGKIYSFFYTSIYILALVGGLIADRLRNYKGTIIAGILVMTVGYAALMVPSVTSKAVVIGALDVYYLVKAALLEFVAVVGDVGGKIGVEAVCTAQNIVLELELVYFLGLFARLEQVLTQYLGGLEPKCAVLFICVATLGELGDTVGDIARLMQARFIKPLVVLDAVALKV